MLRSQALEGGNGGVAPATPSSGGPGGASTRELSPGASGEVGLRLWMQRMVAEESARLMMPARSTADGRYRSPRIWPLPSPTLIGRPATELEGNSWPIDTPTGATRPCSFDATAGSDVTAGCGAPLQHLGHALLRPSRFSSRGACDAEVWSWGVYSTVPAQIC